jgi:hypothetical protein
VPAAIRDWESLQGLPAEDVPADWLDTAALHLAALWTPTPTVTVTPQPKASTTAGRHADPKRLPGRRPLRRESRSQCSAFRRLN